jgi:hypothetical protein
MSPALVLNNSDQQPPPTGKLSIEIEPSYSLIMALTELFRVQKKPEQSLELCRLGLNYFPGDLGLRLGIGLSYLDLSQPDKAWMEIQTVVRELNQLAPLMNSIAEHFRPNEQNNLGEWLHQLSQVLSKSPEDPPQESFESPAPSLFPEEEFQLKGHSRVQAYSPRGDSKPQTYSPIAQEEISRLSPGKINQETEKLKETHPDSNILSTLTGWLSQLKESKA